jgi:hypothetical protein
MVLGCASHANTLHEWSSHQSHILWLISPFAHHPPDALSYTYHSSLLNRLRPLKSLPLQHEYQTPRPNLSPARLGFLFRPLGNLLRLGRLIARILHLLVTPGAAALMRRIVLLRDVGLRVGLEVFVDTFVVLVRAAPVGRDDLVVAGREILVLECGREYGSGLYRSLSAKCVQKS